MTLGSVTKLGGGAAALALLVAVGVGFAPTPQTQLPTIQVWHSPT